MKPKIWILLLFVLPSKLFAQLDNPVILDYYDYLMALPMDKLSSIEQATAKYAELFKNESPALADTGFVLFDEFRMVVLDQVDFEVELLMKLTNPAIPEDIVAAQNYWAYIQKYGFSFAESADVIIIIPSKQYVVENFYPFFSRPMQQFMNKTWQEEREGFIVNDSLAASVDALVTRIVWWDNFIAKNSNFIYLKDAERYYDEYLQIFIFGLPNSPLFTKKPSIFKSSGNKLAPVYKTAYRNFVKEYPNTMSAKIVGKYLEALKACRYRQCINVQVFTW